MTAHSERMYVENDLLDFWWALKKLFSFAFNVCWQFFVGQFEADFERVQFLY